MKRWTRRKVAVACTLACGLGAGGGLAAVELADDAAPRAIPGSDAVGVAYGGDRNRNGVPDVVDAWPAEVPVMNSAGETVGTVEKRLISAPIGARAPFADLPKGAPVRANGAIVGYFVPDLGFVTLAEADAPTFAARRSAAESRSVVEATTPSP